MPVNKQQVVQTQYKNKLLSCLLTNSYSGEINGLFINNTVKIRGFSGIQGNYNRNISNKSNYSYYGDSTEQCLY
jgi:hypothetical protein